MKTDWQILAVTTVTVLTMAAPLASWAEQCPGNAQVYPPTAKPYGKSYAEWTVQWWKWALAQPVKGHPFSNDGAFDCNSATNGQSGPVWFLATSPIPTQALPPNPALPPDLSGLLERRCTIPANTSILFGLVNAEFSTLEKYPTERAQRDAAKSAVDQVVKSSLICVIDGQMVGDLDDFRFASPQFTFQAPSPWIFAKKGGTGKAVADGYYVMIKPLSKGHHTLSCGGRFHFSTGPDQGFGNTYHLFVEDSARYGKRPGDSVGPRAGDPGKH